MGPHLEAIAWQLGHRSIPSMVHALGHTVPAGLESVPTMGPGSGENSHVGIRCSPQSLREDRRCEVVWRPDVAQPCRERLHGARGAGRPEALSIRRAQNFGQSATRKTATIFPIPAGRSEP